MSDQFCFSCGREVLGPSSPGQAAMCDRCRARHDPEARTGLFVRRVGNPEEGPLTREAVEDQLGRGLLGPEDRVREEDGPWSRLDQHAWFAGFFVAGDPRNEKLQAVLRERQAEQDRIRRKGLMSKGLRFLLGAGGVFAVAGAALSIPLLFQDERVQDVASLGGQAVDQAVLSTRKAMDDEAAVADLAQTQGLPGEGLIAALQAREGRPEIVAADAVEAGLAGLMDGSRAGVSEAVAQLELAVAQEPENVAALASLAWAYAVSPDSENRASSAVALDRAVALDMQAPGVSRARAGLALHAASPKQALTHAEACLQAGAQDGVCFWLQGRAFSQLGEVSKAQRSMLQAQEVLGDSPELRLGMAQAAVEGMRLEQALPELLAFVKEHPDHVGAKRSLVEVYRLGGAPSKALKHARSALQAEPQDRELRKVLAALQLELGQGSQAIQTLGPLLVEPSPDEDTLLIAAWAALDAGKARQAAELADKLLLLTPSSAKAHLLAATVAKNQGDAQALSALRGAKPELLGPQQAALYHLAAAELHRAGGELREAEDAVRLALEQRPGWVAAQIALAEILLDSGNLGGATQILGELWKAYPDPERPFVVGLPRLEARHASLERGLVAVPVGNPQHGAAQEALATFQAAQCVAYGRRCVEASTALKGILARDDSQPGPGVWLDQVYLRGGEAALAYADLDKRIAQQGPLANLLLLRAQAQAASKRDPSSDLNEALRRSAGQLGIRGQVAAALLRAGKVDGAVEQARLALQQDSDDLGARRTLLAVGERGR